MSLLDWSNHSCCYSSRHHLTLGYEENFFNNTFALGTQNLIWEGVNKQVNKENFNFYNTITFECCDREEFS